MGSSGAPLRPAMYIGGAGAALPRFCRMLWCAFLVVRTHMLSAWGVSSSKGTEWQRLEIVLSGAADNRRWALSSAVRSY